MLGVRNSEPADCIVSDEEKPKADKLLCLAAEYKKPGQSQKNEDDERLGRIHHILSSQGVTINVVFKTQYSPVTQLAIQNKTEAVNFLLTLCGASRLDAALGYAIGGHVESANQLLATVTNPTERYVLSAEMICGYIQNEEWPKKFKKEVLELWTDTPDEEYYFRYASVYSLAFVDDLDEIIYSQWLKEAKSPHQFANLLSQAMQGYAQAGNVKKCQNILLKASNSEEKESLFRDMIFSLTHGNHSSKVAEILQVEKDPIIRAIIKGEEAQGYCFIGEFDSGLKSFEQLRILSESFAIKTESEVIAVQNFMILTSAQGGHVANALKILQHAIQTDPLLQEQLLIHFVNGLAKSCAEPNVINDILEKLEIPEEQVQKLFAHVSCVYASRGLVTHAKRLLERTQENQKIIVFKSLMTGYVTGEFHQEAKMLSDFAQLNHDSFLGDARVNSLITRGRKDLLNEYLRSLPFDEQRNVLEKLTRKGVKETVFLRTKTPAEARNLLSMFYDRQLRVYASTLLPIEAGIYTVNPSPLFRVERFFDAKIAHNLTDEQAMAWCQVGLPYWLLCLNEITKGKKIGKLFTFINSCGSNITHLITSFLLPVALGPDEAKELTAKVELALVHKKPAVKALQKYYDSTGYYVPFWGKVRQDQNALQLLQACKKAKSKEALVKVLQAEFKTPVGEVVHEQFQRLTDRREKHN